jgi:death-on-curing protein
MIEIQEVLIVHDILIKEFGGSDGIRDYNLLVSALGRPFTGSHNTEFYPTVYEKAGALIESLVKNHPFVDGNKRTGYVVMRLFLFCHGYNILASQEEKYEFVMNIASGNSTLEEITLWILNHLEK